MLLDTWKREVITRALNSQRTDHILTYSQLESGLLMRCVGIVYNDFPAVEWILELENKGKQNTPIIIQFMSLDVDIFNTNPTEFILHHSLGEFNSAQSFAPVTNVLRPYSSLILCHGQSRRIERNCLSWDN